MELCRARGRPSPGTRLGTRVLFGPVLTASTSPRAPAPRSIPLPEPKGHGTRTPDHRADQMCGVDAPPWPRSAETQTPTLGSAARRIPIRVRQWRPRCGPGLTPYRQLRARLVALHQLRSAITSRPTNLGVDSCSVHWASAQANQPPASRTSRRAFAPDSLARVQEPGRPAVTTAAIQPPPAGTGSRPEGWTVRDWNCRGLPPACPGGVRRSVRAKSRMPVTR